MPPNKCMQRAGRHRVLGRGRPSLVLWLAPRARVLTGQPAGADVGRYAALIQRWRVGRVLSVFGAALLGLFTYGAVLAADVRPLAELFEAAAKNTGAHGRIPLLTLAGLPPDMRLGPAAVVLAEERPDGYALNLVEDRGGGDITLIIGIYGTRAPSEALLPDLGKGERSVSLPNGDMAVFNPVSCEAPCIAPAGLKWRASNAEYLLKINMPSAVSPDIQLTALRSQLMWLKLDASR